MYDKKLNVTWLANGNLAATNKFNVKGINQDGSMPYDVAVEWVDSLNRANYLGHKNWTIPASPKSDTTCSRKKGPQGNAFGFHCKNSTLGSLYSRGLGLRDPQTAVPMPPSTTKSFKNFQPYLYWAGPLSGHEGTGDSLNVNGFISFSFNTGYKGSNVVPNYLYVLPMFVGKAIGPVPAGALVYDAAQDVTWLADANFAATQRFDFDTSRINRDGAMDHDTAIQ